MENDVTLVIRCFTDNKDKVWYDLLYMHNWNSHNSSFKPTDLAGLLENLRLYLERHESGKLMHGQKDL